MRFFWFPTMFLQEIHLILEWHIAIFLLKIFILRWIKIVLHVMSLSMAFYGRVLFLANRNNKNHEETFNTKIFMFHAMTLWLQRLNISKISACSNGTAPNNESYNKIRILLSVFFLTPLVLRPYNRWSLALNFNWPKRLKCVIFFFANKYQIFLPCPEQEYLFYYL